CSIGGMIRQRDELMPANSCRSCQPEVERTLWSPVPDGTECTGGFCNGGTGDPSSCFIYGVLYADGTVRPCRPGNWCQYCDVTKSRTSWSALPNNSICGKGCLSGFCQLGLGCQIVGVSACASTDCGAAFCDANTGDCKVTPANVGGPCSGISLN